MWAAGLIAETGPFGNRALLPLSRFATVDVAAPIL
jgi:hypothetical protein